MKKYVLALDEGTTSARAVVFDAKGKVVSVSQREFAQIYPKEGWVEHDPMEIYSCQYGVMTEAITKMDNESARDGGRMGQTYGQARLQCDSLAMPPHRGTLRTTEKGRI